MSDNKETKQAPAVEAGARDERVAFEKWFSDDGQFPRAVERAGYGYRLSSAQQAWEAWQACRSDLARIYAPKETTYEECMASMLDRMEAAEADAFRYRYLRERPLDAIDKGGVFAGRTPDNVVLNGDDLDKAIDAESGVTFPARASEAAPGEPVLPQGFSAKRVEGHGWVIDPPSGTRWVAYEGTPAGELMQALAAPQPASEQKAAREIEQYVLSVLPSVYYMDPPDGGSVTVLEQLRRMADDAAKYRAILAAKGDGQ